MNDDVCWRCAWQRYYLVTDWFVAGFVEVGLVACWLAGAGALVDCEPSTGSMSGQYRSRRLVMLHWSCFLRLLRRETACVFGGHWVFFSLMTRRMLFGGWPAIGH